jgi:toxin FitB
VAPAVDARHQASDVYLLDTNILSEVRRPKPHGGVMAWLARVPDSSLFVSAVTFGELQTGIELARATDPAKAQEIEAWADALMNSAQIVAPDAPTFRLCAQLMHRQPEHLFEDALIAATAIRRQFVVVTRNVRDFERFEVQLHNPFEAER